MNVITDSFKQLVERKLWPIALLLLAGLLAVPVLLAKDPETTTLPTPTAAESPKAEDASLVTLADSDKTDRVRAVLGDRKNPFRPAQIKRVKKADDLLGGGVGTDAKVTGGETKTGGTDTPVVEVTPVATPKPTYDLYSLKVRFGSSEGALVTREVKRLTGLPGGTHPAALYLGLLDDHKSAVFIIDAGVEVLGDGHCDPSPEDCQTLTMKRGETEFLTRGDKQYELDLVDIHVKKTDDAKAAKASRTAVALDGRKKLKSLVGRAGALRYDATAGALKKLPRAAAAKAAKAGRSATFTSTG